MRFHCSRNPTRASCSRRPERKGTTSRSSESLRAPWRVLQSRAWNSENGVPDHVGAEQRRGVFVGTEQSTGSVRAQIDDIEPITRAVLRCDQYLVAGHPNPVARRVAGDALDLNLADLRVSACLEVVSATFGVDVVDL